MTGCQFMANSYLRLLSEQHNKPKDSTTISTQSVQELQLVLAQIQKFVRLMSIGKASLKVECHIQISSHEGVSKETYI